MRPFLLALLVVLASAPHVGSTPATVVAVLEDGTRDVTVTDTGRFAVALPETDVRRVTFAHADGDLVIVLDVVDLAHRLPAGPEESYGFMLYTVPGPGVVIVADWYASLGGPLYRMTTWPPPACATCPREEPTTLMLTGTWDLDASRVTVRAPLTAFADDLRDLRVLAATSAKGPGPLAALGSDVVPDNGRGIDVPVR